MLLEIVRSIDLVGGARGWRGRGDGWFFGWRRRCFVATVGLDVIGDGALRLVGSGVGYVALHGVFVVANELVATDRDVRRVDALRDVDVVGERV